MLASLISFQKVILAAVSYMTTQFYGIYADTLFLATLDVMSFTGGNALAWLSFFFAIIFYPLVLSLLVCHFMLIWNYQKTKAETGTEEGDQKMEKFLIKYQKAEVLYKDFKDSSFIEQAFLLFLTTRAAVTGIFMSALWAYPGVQTVFNILMNILTIIYLSFKTPYKSVPIIFQQIIYELGFILVNICFLIMAALDVNETPNDNLRALLGDIVINSILFSKFVPIITIVPKAVDVILEGIKVIQNRKKSQNNSGVTAETPLSSNLKREITTLEEGQPIIKELVTRGLTEKDEESSKPSSRHQLPQKVKELSKPEDIKINMKSMAFIGEEDNEFGNGGTSPIMQVYVRETLIHKEGETSPKHQTPEIALRPIKLYNIREEGISRTCLGEEGNEFENEGMSPIIKVDVRETLMK